jgi:hypothetical protein
MTRKGLPGLDLNGIEKVERGAENVAAIDDFFVFCSLKIFFRRQNSAGKTAKRRKMHIDSKGVARQKGESTGRQVLTWLTGSWWKYNSEATNGVCRELIGA